MNELELVELLSMLQVKFPNLEWGLTEELDWIEVNEGIELIYAFINFSETERICILVGDTLRVVFEYKEYANTIGMWWWSKNREELLNSLEVWLQDLKEALKDVL
jgi:hypothetical protein